MDTESGVADEGGVVVGMCVRDRPPVPVQMQGRQRLRAKQTRIRKDVRRMTSECM
jgi:hypothetical protein